MCGKSEAKRRAGGERLCFLSGDAHTTNHNTAAALSTVPDLANIGVSGDCCPGRRQRLGNITCDNPKLEVAIQVTGSEVVCAYQSWPAVKLSLDLLVDPSFIFFINIPPECMSGICHNDLWAPAKSSDIPLGSIDLFLK